VIDFTPELRQKALAVLEKYNYGPVFTPPSLQKPTILMPGIRRRELSGRGVRS
jgi:quinoprotein glucose dehydrogenase